MEIVTLAHVQLNRIGSASSIGIVQHHERFVIREVADATTSTLRSFVIEVAEEYGENCGSLATLQEVNSYQVGLRSGQIAFNIQGRSVQYGEVYAICFAHPALKVEQRYFKLEEVLP